MAQWFTGVVREPLGSKPLSRALVLPWHISDDLGLGLGTDL